MTGKEKLRRTGAIRALILRSLLFFPADMYLRNRYIVIVHRGIFTRSFFVIFRFVGVHFRNRYIIVGQIIIFLYPAHPFLSPLDHREPGFAPEEVSFYDSGVYYE